MKSIEHLPHTADIKIRLVSDSVTGLFEAGLEGMNQLLKEKACRKPQRSTVKKMIHIKSLDLTNLIIEFLGEVLTLSYTLKAVFCTLRVDYINNQEIICEIGGINVLTFDEDIKAVTYHGADVQLNAKGQYETSIVFDI